MPLFASDAEVYEHVGRLIQDALADDELWEAIARADAAYGPLRDSPVRHNRRCYVPESPE